MPENKQRDFDNSSRRKRLAMLKKGPGVFVYDGSAVDQEWTPTPLRTRAGEPMIGEDGMPVTDQDGGLVFERPGKLIPDGKGGFMLGGPPKIKRLPLETRVVRGVSFPAGKAVLVEDAALALKLRGMDSFDEFDGEEAEKALAAEDKPKRGRKKKPADEVEGSEPALEE